MCWITFNVIEAHFYELIFHTHLCRPVIVARWFWLAKRRGDTDAVSAVIGIVHDTNTQALA
jgi:hypothetical protein